MVQPEGAAAPQEPAEEEVARAFSMYDTNATGEIPTSSLDGEWGDRVGSLERFCERIQLINPSVRVDK